MKFSTFIFSRNKRIVIARHSLFWLIWMGFYSVLDVVNKFHSDPSSANTEAQITEVCTSTIIDIFYCYTIIYFLIPKFYFKARFKQFFLLWLLHNLFTLLLFRLFAIFITPEIRHFYGANVNAPLPFYIGVLNLFISIGFEGCMAAAIVLGKYWYRSNQHLLRIYKEHKNVLSHIKVKELLVIPDSILQTIFQEASFESGPDDFNATTIHNSKSVVLQLLENMIQHSQTSLIALEEEIQSVELLYELKRSAFKNLQLEVSAITDEFDISSNILLFLSFLPFLEAKDLENEKEILLRIDINKEELTYEMHWSKKNSFGTLSKQQLDTLSYIKSTIHFYYPSSNEFYLITNSSKLCLKICLNLKQHI